MPEAPLNPALATALAPPVMEARRWVEEAGPEALRNLLNLSQAAPVEPPPEGLRRAMADAALNVWEAHLYGPVLGDLGLREEVALKWTAHYEARVEPASVAITAGCNQAFCAAVATVAGPGDAVILPVPWYFNHKMWLDMAGVATQPLACGPDMLPDPDVAAAAITGETKAIVLVTPNNPTGAEYPADLMDRFLELCIARNLVLIVDETYRDFHAAEGPPHRLFSHPDWRRHLIHLYSFSKVYRLTGHRVGALVTGATRIAQAEKFLDTVAICPPRLGQVAAHYGLRHLAAWVQGERAEILRRRTALAALMPELPGWRLLGLGAYFAYVAHPFDLPSETLCKRLVAEQGLLLLPGTMFTPADRPGTEWGGRAQVRIAFANADAAGLADLVRRLRAFRA